MGCEREKYAEAEDFERMLAADDRWLQPAGPQDRPVPWYKMDRYDCQGQKMSKSQNVEIDLVDRVDQLLEPLWHVRARRGQIPRERNQKREDEIRCSNDQSGASFQHGGKTLGSPQRAPGTKDEQQLPGKRIEEPMSASDSSVGSS